MLDIQFDETSSPATLKLERTESGWRVDGVEKNYEFIRCDDVLYVRFQGKNYATRILKSENGSFVVEVDGVPISLRVLTERDRLLAKMGHGMGSGSQKSDLKSPMPGMVLKILVKAGDSVAKGDPLLILESMKMENVLKSAQNGIISEVAAKEGSSVEKNQLLLRYRS